MFMNVLIAAAIIHIPAIVRTVITITGCNFTVITITSNARPKMFNIAEILSIVILFTINV